MGSALTERKRCRGRQMCPLVSYSGRFRRPGRTRQGQREVGPAWELVVGLRWVAAWASLLVLERPLAAGWRWAALAWELERVWPSLRLWEEVWRPPWAEGPGLAGKRWWAAECGSRSQPEERRRSGRLRARPARRTECRQPAPTEGLPRQRTLRLASRRGRRGAGDTGCG